MQTLIVRNPHSVLAALDMRPKSVIGIEGLLKGNDTWKQVVQVARANGVPFHEGPIQRRSNQDHDIGRDSGILARITVPDSLEVEEVLSESPGQKDRILFLDSVQDPQNLGSIFRTAAFFGVKGIIIPEHRAVAITSVVMDISSGGVEYVPHAIVTNMNRAIELAQERGYWVLGTSEHAKKTVREYHADRAWAFVLGNEESGVRELTLKICDDVVRIDASGPVASLNVSVSAAIILSHFR